MRIMHSIHPTDESLRSDLERATVVGEATLEVTDDYMCVESRSEVAEVVVFLGPGERRQHNIGLYPRDESELGNAFAYMIQQGIRSLDEREYGWVGELSDDVRGDVNVTVFNVHL